MVAREIASGRETILGADDAVDVEDVMIHPTRHVVEAIAYAPARRRWTIVDPAVRADFDALNKLSNDDLHIVSRDEADTTWVVAFHSDRGPIRYYLWDRARKHMRRFYSVSVVNSTRRGSPR